MYSWFFYRWCARAEQLHTYLVQVVVVQCQSICWNWKLISPMVRQATMQPDWSFHNKHRSPSIGVSELHKTVERQNWEIVKCAVRLYVDQSGPIWTGRRAFFLIFDFVAFHSSKKKGTVLVFITCHKLRCLLYTYSIFFRVVCSHFPEKNNFILKKTRFYLMKPFKILFCQRTLRHLTSNWELTNHREAKIARIRSKGEKRRDHLDISNYEKHK